MEKRIKIDVKLKNETKSLEFNVNTQAYETLQNQMSMDKKTVPYKTFLKATCVPECNETLNELLDYGVALELGSKVTAEFTSDVVIEVGE